MTQKNLTFFVKDENFQSMIEENLHQKIKNLSQIPTGWTNFVFEFQTEDDTKYIARFPRDDFFIKAMDTDIKACTLLKKLLNIKTTDSKAYFSDGRIFCMYEKIEGATLGELLPTLSAEEKKEIGEEIAEFLFHIHSLDLKNIPLELQGLLSDFCLGVVACTETFENFEAINELKEDEKKELVVVHGDLNIGNIILDENHKIVAFLDFAFFGVSTREIDVTRLACRSEESFFGNILAHYEEISKINFDKKIIEEKIALWNDVEKHYIIYIMKYLTDIKFH